MSAILFLILAGVIGYVCGSFPNGYLLVRLIKGEDIRTIGSGRSGGTNSMRAAGLPVGFTVAILDVVKGAVAIWLTRWVLGLVGVDTELLPWFEIMAGILAVIGHNWSMFLGFKGGAGTGPNVGWATAIWWPFFPIALIVMPGMLILSGMASLSSIVLGALIPVGFAIMYFTGPIVEPIYILGGVITLAIVLWALRPNIKRMMAGEERLVGPRARRKQRQQEQSS